MVFHMQKWPSNIKKKARALRKSGAFFGEITKELGVPKSTLHYWVREIRRPAHLSKEARIKWLKTIQPLGAQANRKKRVKEIEEIIKKVKKEVGTYDLSDVKTLRMVLSMLYWAEGTKLPKSAQIEFANTDPKMALLFITLLRKCYPIDEEKLKARLHLHHYHNIKKAEKFWSDLLDVPLEQFYKVYIKPRSKTKKFRRNFMGICFIRYGNTDLKHKILNTAYVIQERICKT
jgi:transposase-like protein